VCPRSSSKANSAFGTPSIEQFGADGRLRKLSAAADVPPGDVLV
jgi:hypothetical protein